MKNPVITIAHQKGGVGKSTICQNLAYHLKAKAIVDLDLENALSLVNEKRGDKGFKPLNIVSCNNEKSFKAFIQAHKAKNNDEIALIDCGGFDGDMNTMAIFVSDMIIMPAPDKGFGKEAIPSFEKILQRVSEYKKSKIKAHLVIYGVSPNSKPFSKKMVSHRKEMQGELNEKGHIEILDSIVRIKSDIATASGKGLAVKEFWGALDHEDDFEILAKEVRKKLNI